MHTKIAISLPEELLKELDAHIKEAGHGATRSGFIRVAVKEKIRGEEWD